MITYSHVLLEVYGFVVIRANFSIFVFIELVKDIIDNCLPSLFPIFFMSNGMAIPTTVKFLAHDFFELLLHCNQN